MTKPNRKTTERSTYDSVYPCKQDGTFRRYFGNHICVACKRRKDYLRSIENPVWERLYGTSEKPQESVSKSLHTDAGSLKPSPRATRRRLWPLSWCSLSQLTISFVFSIFLLNSLHVLSTAHVPPIKAVNDPYT